MIIIMAIATMIPIVQSYTLEIFCFLDGVSSFSINAN